jgi:hypothetical protein
MKRTFHILIFLLTSKQFIGQINFVSNPSFEDTVICPMASSQIDRAQGWWTAGDTPDYFNSCSSNYQFSTPFNLGGYQEPSTGNAYSALATYASFYPNAREFIISQLTTTLTTGTKYFVSFKVCLSISSSIEAYIATNKLGAKFSTNSYTWSSNPTLNNLAHVYTNSIITDSVNWTTIKGSFLADSNYKYIIIGNFFDDSNTSSFTFTNSSQSFAYYYIDDVCVSTDSMLCAVQTRIEKSAKNKNFLLFPNPTVGNLTIKMMNGSNIQKISVIDKYGQTILTEINYLSKQLDLNRFPDGLYFIKVISDGRTFFEKFIVRH